MDYSFDKWGGTGQAVECAGCTKAMGGFARPTGKTLLE